MSSRGYVLFYRLRGTEGKAVQAFNEALAAKLSARQPAKASASAASGSAMAGGGSYA